MDHTHDAESDDDLDARLARVFEERGIPIPPPRPAPRPLPPAPVARVDAPAPVAKVDAPAPRPQALPKASPRPAPVAGKPAQPPVAPRRSSRREKTILLAMLGTLAGAFVGVLSMKLLVPRAPNGAGPDIQLESVGSGGVDLVDPPVLTALPPTAAIPPDPFRSLGLPPAAPGDEKTALHSGEPSAGDGPDYHAAAAVDADRSDAALGAGRDIKGVRKCIIDAIVKAQGQGCSPGILGVAIGGDRVTSWERAKELVLRKLGTPNPDPKMEVFEQELVKDLNTLGIGPMGYGGVTTVLGVAAEEMYRHPASFYVSIAYMCWSSRRGTLTLAADGQPSYDL